MLSKKINITPHYIGIAKQINEIKYFLVLLCFSPALPDAAMVRNDGLLQGRTSKTRAGYARRPGDSASRPQGHRLLLIGGLLRQASGVCVLQFHGTAMPAWHH